MSETLFDRVALIGIGLIGSSRAGLAPHSPAYDRRLRVCAETLAVVRRLELADRPPTIATAAVPISW
jgi:hypothetical protein